MPHIKVQSDGFLILPDEGSKAHSAKFAKSLGQSNCKEAFANVVFHCKNNTKFRANKLVLGYSSKLLGKIFQTKCDLATYLDLSYDILCPGFDPEAVKRVLEILYTGETYINANNLKLYKEMQSILTALQISMTLPDLTQSYVAQESFMGIKQEMIQESSEAECGAALQIGEVYRPFVCTLCDSEFQQSEDFQKHLDSHTGISDDLTIEEIDLEHENQQNPSKNDTSGDSVFSIDESPKRKSISLTEDCNQVNKQRKRNSVTTKSSSSEVGSSKKARRSAFEESESSSTRQIVRYYNCNLCETVIGHYSNLLFHLSTNHFQEETKRFYGPKEWSCSLCTDEVTSEKQLVRHLVTKHNVLEKVIPSRSDLEKSSFFKSATDIKAIKDSVLNNNKKTDNRQQKKNQPEKRTAISSSNKGYKCNICNAKIRYYRNLLVHLAMIHYKEELKSKYGEREWECGTCKKVFDAERKLLSHLANRHSDFQSLIPPKNAFKIFSSSKSEKSDVSKEKHQEVAKGFSKSDPHKRKFKCRECNAISLRYSDSMIHVALIHHRQEIMAMFNKVDEKYACNSCPKVLGSQKSLIYHLMTSHKALSEHIPRADSFDFENQKIATKNKIKREKSELKIKRESSDFTDDENAEFQCSICKSKTSSKPSLARHMAWAHYRQELKQFYGKTDTECGLCEAKTKDELSLVRHIANVHDKLKNIMKYDQMIVDSKKAPEEPDILTNDDQQSDNSFEASMQ